MNLDYLKINASYALSRTRIAIQNVFAGVNDSDSSNPLQSYHAALKGEKYRRQEVEIL